MKPINGKTIAPPLLPPVPAPTGPHLNVRQKRALFEALAKHHPFGVDGEIWRAKRNEHAYWLAYNERPILVYLPGPQRWYTGPQFNEFVGALPVGLDPVHNWGARPRTQMWLGAAILRGPGVVSEMYRAAQLVDDL